MAEIAAEFVRARADVILATRETRQRWRRRTRTTDCAGRLRAAGRPRRKRVGCETWRGPAAMSLGFEYKKTVDLSGKRLDLLREIVPGGCAAWR